MSGGLLSLTAVSKSFGEVRALDDLTLRIDPGERVALLGHNGAGKTTMMRLALGFIRPDHGQVTIDGQAPGSSAARRRIAYLPESVTFPKGLTGREILTLYARLKGVRRADAEAVLAQVGLQDAAARRSGTYSKGMRQRLGLAQALIGHPRLMLLDEPTSGLDPLSWRDFYALLEAAAAGTAVVISSHSLKELEARTDRVAILRRGRLVADAPLAALQAAAALPVRIRVQARSDAVEEVAARLDGRRMNGQSVELLCPAGEKMARLQAIGALGPAVTDFEVPPPSLDEVYRHFTTLPDEEPTR